MPAPVRAALMLGLVFWHLPTASLADEDELNARPTDATIIHINDEHHLSGEAPANLVVFQPQESQPATDNLLLVKAEDATGANAMSLRVSVSSGKFQGHYQIGGSVREVELAVNREGKTYLASAGNVSMHYDGHRLHGQISEAQMSPMQADASAYTLSAVFDAQVDLSCWTARQVTGESPGFRLDHKNQSLFCQSLSISEILPQ